MSTLAVTKPFSLSQTLRFLGRFPPCKGDYALGPDSITAAICIGTRATWFTLRDAGAEVALEVGARELAGEVERAAAHFVGAGDDVAGFYAAAEGDLDFAPRRAALHGLHHVSFLTLEEVAVYSVLMQRTPIALASRLRARFFERFGVPVRAGGRPLRALPRFPALLALTPDDIASAIGHRLKAERIVDVVRGVAEIGEAYLRTAAYADAKAALLGIRGIGPFSAMFILLRGLGRMDEAPLERFAPEARGVYRTYDPRAIERRYGRHIGYWSFYVKIDASR